MEVLTAAHVHLQNEFAEQSLGKSRFLISVLVRVPGVLIPHAPRTPSLRLLGPKALLQRDSGLFEPKGIP